MATDVLDHLKNNYFENVLKINLGILNLYPMVKKFYNINFNSFFHAFYYYLKLLNSIYFVFDCNLKLLAYMDGLRHLTLSHKIYHSKNQ